MMTWEETIKFIRNKPEWEYLVSGCYYDEDLEKNVKRFRKSDEYRETLRFFKRYGVKNGSKIIDVGAGNGIAAVSFALDGFDVVALEPDPSDTIGNGAIAILKDKLNLANLKIITAWGETIPFPEESFDLVYARQTMHHAHNLNLFIKEVARILKHEGIFFANRDHVVNNQEQLREFLEHLHPLNKFYGGENAYTEYAYEQAFKDAGLQLVRKFQHLDNIILYDKFMDKNYFKNLLRKKIGPLANIKFLVEIYRKRLKRRNDDYKAIAGRCNAYILRKR